VDRRRRGVLGVQLPTSFLVAHLHGSEVCEKAISTCGFRVSRRHDSRDRSSCHLISVPSFERGAAGKADGALHRTSVESPADKFQVKGSLRRRFGCTHVLDGVGT
jgi:hypothetical protein